jgi:hypothetical protein
LPTNKLHWQWGGQTLFSKRCWTILIMTFGNEKSKPISIHHTTMMKHEHNKWLWP